VLHVRTAGDPVAVLPQIQDAVRRLDPNVPLFEVRTIAEHLEVSTFLQRMAASLVGGFGLLAVLLAAVGLYSVIATTVVQRTPEIGMRIALGASRGAIVALILKQGLGLTLIGVAIGLLAAFGATRLVGSLLVGVSATDALTFTGTAIGLVVVAAAAAYLPARRAAAVDPIVALRNE
jgi:putative ABC transport system permease protein